MLTLPVLVLTACGGATETETEATVEIAEAGPLPEGSGTRDDPYVGRGVIDEIGGGELLLDHEAIPGWMPPMRMALPVTEEVDLSRFNVGDRVVFRVEQGGEAGYRIFRIDPAG